MRSRSPPRSATTETRARAWIRRDARRGRIIGADGRAIRRRDRLHEPTIEIEHSSDDSMSFVTTS
jgi:hypothetical protein